MDHIITNSILNNNFKTATIRSDISDHFPITYSFNVKGTTRTKELKEKYKFNQVINKSSIESFKLPLQKSSWDIIRATKGPNEAYKKFLTNFKDHKFITILCQKQNAK